MSMDWVAIKGIMAAQIVLATDCPQDDAVQIIERHFVRNRGRIGMTAGDICSMILIGIAEASSPRAAWED